MKSSDEIRRALQCGDPRCDCHAAAGLAHCPAHADGEPSLVIREKESNIFAHCQAGCSQQAVRDALSARGLWAERTRRTGSIGRPESALTLAEQLAAPVFDAPDPLQSVEVEIRRLGYGGDLRPVLVLYLAATSRVLAPRPGTMPVHAVLLSPPSAGKSYTVNTVLRLLPASAYHVIDAGSPRALIYDDADLRHRVVVFGEADSLPAGEDNPAASAIRTLLQEGWLCYSVVRRDPDTGDFKVCEVKKEGPSVLITTATRRLGEQLMTRLFVLELADDPEQVRAALNAQAALEIKGAAEPSPALLALQQYLQWRAPWDVVIPFAAELAGAIGSRPLDSPVLRDFARLLSLVKAVTVLRHKRRQVDARGRLIAELDDYVAVLDLVDDIYSTSGSVVSRRVRDVVAVVARLEREKENWLAAREQKITVTRVSQELGIGLASAHRAVKHAIKAGWLVKSESRNGFPADLSLGEPLPYQDGLPEPEELADCGLTPLPEAVHAPESDILSEKQAVSQTPFTFSPLTDGYARSGAFPPQTQDEDVDDTGL